MLNRGLGHVIDLIALIHQKVVETHRLSINRLLIAKTRVRAWMIFQSVPHLRRSVRGLEAYDVEVKRSLVENDVAVLVLFTVHCASACDVSTWYPDCTQFFPIMCSLWERERADTCLCRFVWRGGWGYRYLPKASCFTWSKILSFKKVPASAAWSPQGWSIQRGEFEEIEIDKGNVERFGSYRFR